MQWMHSVPPIYYMCHQCTLVCATNALCVTPVHYVCHQCTLVCATPCANAQVLFSPWTSLWFPCEFLHCVLGTAHVLWCLPGPAIFKGFPGNFPASTVCYWRRWLLNWQLLPLAFNERSSRKLKATEEEEGEDVALPMDNCSEQLNANGHCHVCSPYSVSWIGG